MKKSFTSSGFVVQLLSFAFILFILVVGRVSFGAESKSSTARIEHAKELLGKRYKKKVIKKSEKETEVSDFVRSASKKFLPKSYKSQSAKISKAILDSSAKFDLDPIFVMAIILNESSFYPKMKGGAGEIGLMQIKPATAEWIAKTNKLKYKNADSLYDPVTNIWLGVAYIHKLRHQFESHSQLYLSAYNIGARKVRMMVSEDRTPKEYVQAVMKRYMALYSGYRIEGTAQEQSEAAFAKAVDVTAKKAVAKN